MFVLVHYDDGSIVQIDNMVEELRPVDFNDDEWSVCKEEGCIRTIPEKYLGSDDEGPCIVIPLKDLVGINQINDLFEHTPPENL